MSELPHIPKDFDISTPRPSDPDWVKAVIVTNAATRERAPETWKYLRQLKQDLPKDEFREFRDDLTAMMAPFTITAHGFVRSLASRDQAEVWQEVRQTIDLLESTGVRAFANSGTLLGLIREGALLKHDDDVDLGVIVPGDTLEEIINNLMDTVSALASRKLLSFWHIDHGHKHISLRTNVATDLFPCWVLDDTLYAYPHGVMDPAIVDPVGTVEIEGLTIPVPANSDAFLAKCYGPDWRTPDDTYVYPWGRSANYFKAYDEEFLRQIAARTPALKEAAAAAGQRVKLENTA